MSRLVLSIFGCGLIQMQQERALIRAEVLGTLQLVHPPIAAQSVSKYGRCTLAIICLLACICSMHRKDVDIVEAMQTKITPAYNTT